MLEKEKDDDGVGFSPECVRGTCLVSAKNAKPLPALPLGVSLWVREGQAERRLEAKRAGNQPSKSDSERKRPGRSFAVADTGEGRLAKAVTVKEAVGRDSSFSSVDKWLHAAGNDGDVVMFLVIARRGWVMSSYSVVFSTTTAVAVRYSVSVCSNCHSQSRH